MADRQGVVLSHHERRQSEADKARSQFVKRLFRADPADPRTFDASKLDFSEREKNAPLIRAFSGKVESGFPSENAINERT